MLISDLAKELSSKMDSSQSKEDEDEIIDQNTTCTPEAPIKIANWRVSFYIPKSKHKKMKSRRKTLCVYSLRFPQSLRSGPGHKYFWKINEIFAFAGALVCCKNVKMWEWKLERCKFSMRDYLVTKLAGGRRFPVSPIIFQAFSRTFRSTFLRLASPWLEA